MSSFKKFIQASGGYTLTPSAKPKLKPKLEKAAKEKTQTKFGLEDKRVEQFKIALKVIDKRKEMEEKLLPISKISDLSGLRREFNSVMIEVFRNIVPQTIPLPLRTSYSLYGLNRFGPSKRNRYSSRFSSDSISELLSHEITDFSYVEDLENIEVYSDKSVALPKSYAGLTPIQIFVKMAIEQIKTHKFRTRKRSIERLTRVYDFVTENEELLKQHEDELRIGVGKRLIWNKSANRYRHTGTIEEGFVESECELIYDNGLKLVSVDDDDFSLFRASSQLDHAFAFASIYNDFNDLVKKLLEVKEARGNKVKNATDKLRKKFARELLVAKAKQISN